MPRFYGTRNTDTLGRFEERVIRSNGCWHWIGSPNSGGYMSTRIHGRTTLAHRLAYELFIGPIPKGKDLDHLCRNRQCVNPHHLEAVEPYENWRRGVSPPRLNKDSIRCKHGHLLDGENLVLRNGAKGRTYRQCRICRMQQAKQWRLRMLALGAHKDSRGRVRAPHLAVPGKSI